MPDSGQLRQLHMREVGWTDTEAFEQGVIQRLEPELMAEKLIFPPQQTVVMAGASSESIPACPKSIASTCDSLAFAFGYIAGGAFRQPLESVAIHAKAETTG